MNKSELVKAIAEKTGGTQAEATRNLEAVLEVIVATVAEGQSVALIGFGTFQQSKRAARTGRNPKTGEAMEIPASTLPKFTPGATFKTAVNKTR